MARTYDLTKGNVATIILNFYFPMFFTNMLQQIYTIADTAIVGKGISDNALAAVGNMSSVTFMIFGFAMGLSNGFAVLIAQCFGAKSYEKLRHVIASSLCLSGIIAVVLTLFSTVFLKRILVFMQTDEQIISDSLTYGYVIFGGLLVTISYNLCSCILRALGDSKTPFIAIIISTAVNIILDYVFIFTFKTGVGGAALATVIAQVVSVSVCFSRLVKIKEIKLKKSDFENNTENIIELLKNGLPMGLMNSITAIGCVVVQYFVNGLGVVYTTAYSACSKFINLFIQPACTAGFTMSSFTSQNDGAKEYGRIKKGLGVCLMIALTAYILLGSLMCFIPRRIAGIMLTGNDAIELAAQYLPMCGVMLFAVDFLFVFRSAVQGLGYPGIPMISGILEMILRVFVIVVLIPAIGFRATAIAEISAWVGALLLNTSAFMFYIRKKTQGPLPTHKKFAYKVKASFSK